MVELIRLFRRKPLGFSLGGNRLRWMIVTAFVVGLLALLGQFSRSGRDPGFDGKSLSEWLDQYRTAWNPGETNQVGGAAEAEHAIRNIGQDAVPELLRMLRKTDSPIDKKLHFLFAKLPILREPQPAWICNHNAAEGFRILGADAKEAVPEVIKVFIEDISPESRFAAAVALRGIGPSASNALPALLEATTNLNSGVRANAAFALGGVTVSTDATIAALIRCLDDPDLLVRKMAIRSLGDFGANASEALPYLGQEAVAPMSRNRLEAIAAIGRIAAGPEEAVPSLIRCLRDTNAIVREAATDALAAFGSQARAAIPLLTEMQNDPNPKVVAAANRALETIQ